MRFSSERSRACNVSAPAFGVDDNGCVLGIGNFFGDFHMR